MREAAYDRLVTKLKEIEPDANKSLVVKKINNLRSNVRKEKKKCDLSMKSGAGTDNVCSPTLWCFNLFDFLGDNDVLSTSFSNLDDEDRSKIDEEETEDTVQQTPPSEKTSTIPLNQEALRKQKKVEHFCIQTQQKNEKMRN